MAVQLLSDPKFAGFQGVKILTRDLTKTWKPPLTVLVTLSDDTNVEIAAKTPFFTFQTSGGIATVSAVAAGHIHEAHFSGDEGSRSCYLDPASLFGALARYLPDDLGARNERAEFEFDTGEPTGVEGVACISELLEDNILLQSDMIPLLAVRDNVRRLNATGTLAEKKAFIADFDAAAPGCLIRFRLVRETVLVPVLMSGKRETTKLFVVFGPGDDCLTLYTAMPGRKMPRHPNPAQFRPEEGGVEGAAFREASDAWLNTVMLVPAAQ